MSLRQNPINNTLCDLTLWHVVVICYQSRLELSQAHFARACHMRGRNVCVAAICCMNSNWLELVRQVAVSKNIHVTQGDLFREHAVGRSCLVWQDLRELAMEKNVTRFHISNSRQVQYMRLDTGVICCLSLCTHDMKRKLSFSRNQFLVFKMWTVLTWTLIIYSEQLPTLFRTRIPNSDWSSLRVGSTAWPGTTRQGKSCHQTGSSEYFSHKDVQPTHNWSECLGDRF